MKSGETDLHANNIFVVVINEADRITCRHRLPANPWPLRVFNIRRRRRPDNSIASARQAPPKQSQGAHWRARVWWRDGWAIRRSTGSRRISDTSADGPTMRRFSHTGRTRGVSAG
jgi:hypothetical protein